MSDYRIYRRVSAAGGFDGATSETATYTQNRFQWSTATTSAVGVWPPLTVGRQNVASVIRVAADAAAPGDLVEILSDSGTTRSAASLSVAGTAWLFALPTDSLRVTSATAGDLEIAVNDLDSGELTEWFACCDGGGGGGGGGECCAYSEVTVDTDTTLAAWVGRLTVFASGVGPPTLDITLPLSTGVPEGDEVVILRLGGTAPVRIIPDVADSVNGFSSVTAAEYYLRNPGEAIRYQRVSGGWSRHQGEQAPPLVQIATLPDGPDPWTSGTQYVAISDPAGGAFNLPSLPSTYIGQRLLLLNLGGATVTVQPVGGQTIDGSTASRNLRIGDSMMLEAATNDWVTGRGDESPDPISSALAVVVNPFRGTQYVEITGGGVSVSLPQTAVLDDLLNTVVFVENLAATTITVIPQGADVIDGGLTTINLNPGARAYFVSAGLGQWDSLVSQEPLAGVVTGAAATSIANALGGGTTIEMTGGAASNVNLPAISSTISPTGATVAVFNSSANAHTVTPFGGQTIDGVAGALAHAAGSKSLFVSDGTSNWIQILSA